MLYTLYVEDSRVMKSAPCSGSTDLDAPGRLVRGMKGGGGCLAILALLVEAIPALPNHHHVLYTPYSLL